MTHFIIQRAAANMPSSCWGRYGKIAVLEVDDDLDQVSMISEHAKGCHRVIEIWDRLHVGSTDQDEWTGAMEQAQELCDRLNRGMDMEFRVGRKQYRLKVVGFDVAIHHWGRGHWEKYGNGKWNGYKLIDCEASLPEEVFDTVDQLMTEEGY